MAIADVTIDGLPKWNVSAYSVTEDASPIDPSKLTGGVGTMTLQIPDDGKLKYASTKVVRLADEAYGTTVGQARDVTIKDQVDSTIEVDSRMYALTVKRTANAYNGTLSGLFTYWFGLCGLTTDIQIDSTISFTAVSVPGWTDVVWDRIRAFCAAYRIEVSLVQDLIVVRPANTRTGVTFRDSSTSTSTSSTELAQLVSVFQYEPFVQRRGLIYPLGGWTPDVREYSVNAGETITETIQLYPDSDADGPLCSIVSIEQPVCVSSVGPSDSSASVYVVSGNDGNIITPAQWSAWGGSLTVAKGADSRSIVLTISAPFSDQYAPYTIAMSSGESDHYSSLRIVGTAVFSSRKKITWQTGVTTDRASATNPPVIDNEFIDTPARATNALLRAMKRYGSPIRALRASTRGINRPGDLGAVKQLTFAQANAILTSAGLGTFGLANAAYAGQTMQAVSDAWLSTLKYDFVNQAFGNVAGAIVNHDFGNYRIMSATIKPDGVDYSAEMETTVSDFNSAMGTMTMAQFNALWSGMKMSDFGLSPLRTA